MYIVYTYIYILYIHFLYTQKPQVRLLLDIHCYPDVSRFCEPSYVAAHDSLPPQPCSTCCPPLCFSSQLYLVLLT